MITDLLSALKTALEKALQETRLTKYQRDANAAPALAPVRVFIGDLPPASARESVFPCVILCPVDGDAQDGELFEGVAFLTGVYNSETGDAEGAEMELAILRSRITRFLREALDTPVAERFTCVRDEKNRYMRWQRSDPLGQPRPFAQVAIISRWSIPGWE